MESSLVFSQFFSCDSDLFSAKPERIYTAGKFHTDIFCPCRIAAKRPQRGFAFSADNDNAPNPCDNGNQHERNGECPDRPTEWFAYRWTFRQKWSIPHNRGGIPSIMQMPQRTTASLPMICPPAAELFSATCMCRS